MSEEMKAKVGLKLDQGMLFKCDLGDMKVKDCYIDEEHLAEVDMLGPNPSRMLGLAVMGCLNASFLFCLNKRNLTVDDLEAHAEVSFKKIEKGYIRVDKIDVKIVPKSNDPATLKRINQCIKKMKNDKMFFKETCIITASVREGINIDVKIQL